MGSRRGFAAGIGAFVCWGLFPIYWKFLKHIPAYELLAHRIVWSLVSILALIALKRRTSEVFAVVRNQKLFLALFITSVLISINWFVYIWAVNAGFIVEASLGYFICPMVNVCLGVLVLGERLRRLQGFAVLLAAIGVCYLTINYGSIPWISLALASSFGVYGMIRKKLPVSSEIGLSFETALLFFPSLGFLVFQEIRHEGAFLHTDLFSQSLLVLSGVVTTVPLLLFTEAARLLPLSSLGLLQYLAPSIQLGLGTLVYGEPFTHAHQVAFPLIWLGLLLFVLDNYRSYRALPESYCRKR